MPTATVTVSPANLEAYWMPFTANRRFKAAPRLLVGAKGMHYFDAAGRQILDAMAGLWCVNAGHAAPRVVEAIQRQAASLDFISSFQMGHPLAFEAAERLAALAPPGMSHVFFANSGSEAVDSALKIARAYHQARGQAKRVRFVGRAKAYHGVGFGGLSVGGLSRHRRDFGPMLAEVSHLGHTLNYEHNAFSRGRPQWGAGLADELEALFTVHDPSTIAAVIVEPVAGAGGVLPPPVGYLERLRELTARHGILLIFDEVITGFGRLGAPFAATALNVQPDLITCAKGMTNGAVPMGGVIVTDEVYAAFMDGPPDALELAHGYTYSGHPLACAAAIATMDTYQEEGLFARAAEIAPYWEEGVHSLRGSPGVVDIRNIGLLAAIDLAPDPKAPGPRSVATVDRCFADGVLIRSAGDTLVLSPPLIISRAEIDRVVESIGRALAV